MTLTDLYKSLVKYQAQSIRTHNLEIVDMVALSMGYYKFRNGKKELKDFTDRQYVLMKISEFYLNMESICIANSKYQLATLDTIARKYYTVCNQLGLNSSLKTTSTCANTLDVSVVLSSNNSLNLRLNASYNEFTNSLELLIINLCLTLMISKGVHGYTVESLRKELRKLDGYNN